MIIKTENDDFSNKTSTLCKNLTDITDKMAKLKLEIKNIKCIFII